MTPPQKDARTVANKAEARKYSTLAERAEVGRAARADLPRSRHGEWAPPPGRTDPLAILVAQETTRVPELLPIRHGRMAASAFAFYRGAAAVMASDLASEPRTGLDVQLCGDAHLVNFGGFAAPDRDLLFDVNDFDETNPGPFRVGSERLVASLEIAGRIETSVRLSAKVLFPPEQQHTDRPFASSQECRCFRSGTQGSTWRESRVDGVRRPVARPFAILSAWPPRLRRRTT